VVDFALFDKRHYPVVSVRDGYRDWVPTYESTVEDLMDLALLDRIETVDWGRTRSAADLGCGTGRTARWLRDKGVGPIDGIDLTPEMVELAAARGNHATLGIADVRASALATGSYDLVIASLVDEHLPELDELYAEARRLMATDGGFVLVGYHPYFIMASGMPTHFDAADGDPVAIETHVHLQSAHVSAARRVGLHLDEMHEQVIDDDWIRLKPKWDLYRGWPISFASVWRPTNGRG
jgi:SAM-dependent methyltransferase